MADETGISFPDGGMVASDSGMSFHSCTKRDYHYLYKENKELRARNAELELEVARLHKEIKYQYLYTSFLLGQTSKGNFKILAVEYADTLNIEREIEAAKAALEANDESHTD